MSPNVERDVVRTQKSRYLCGCLYCDKVSAVPFYFVLDCFSFVQFFLSSFILMPQGMSLPLLLYFSLRVDGVVSISTLAHPLIIDLPSWVLYVSPHPF